MPTHLHDVHQRWVGHARGTRIFDALINQSENKLIDVGVGTSMSFALWFIVSVLIKDRSGLQGHVTTADMRSSHRDMAAYAT